MSRTAPSGPLETSRRNSTTPLGQHSKAGRSAYAGRLSLLAAVVGVVVLLGGAFVLGGPEALAGASVGLVLVALFLLSGRLPFLVDAQLAPGLAYLVLGINYLFRVVLLLVALVVLKDQPWLDARALGVVVIMGALIWNAMALRRHLDAARNSEIPDGEKPDVNSDETLTGSAESIPSATRTVGGGR